MLTPIQVKANAKKYGGRERDIPLSKGLVMSRTMLHWFAGLSLEDRRSLTKKINMRFTGLVLLENAKLLIRLSFYTLPTKETIVHKHIEKGIPV